MSGRAAAAHLGDMQTFNATADATNQIAFEPGPRFLRLRCRWCDAAPGEPCHTTPAGRTLTQPHGTRWDDYRDAMRGGRQFWVLLNDDDPRMGLVAGDLLRCVTYPYDAKFTVLFREDDGFDPECNVYVQEVVFLDFVPYDMEVE